MEHLIQLFGNNTRALEVLDVQEGKKPAARICVKDAAVPVILDFCQRNNLKIAVASYKLSLEFEGSYSTCSSKIPANLPGYTLIFISKKQKIADEARMLEEQQKHAELGRVLGYPDCCCKFFETHAALESQKNNDFVLACLHQSQGFSFPWQMNLFGRYFDFSLLSHCPCLFSCKPSLALAKQRFSLLKENSLALAAAYEGILKSAGLYSEIEGIFLLRGALHEKLFSYTTALATKKTAMYHLLLKHKALTFSEKKEVVLGSQKCLGLFGAYFQ